MTRNRVQVLLMAGLLMFGACGPPVSDEAVIVDAGRVSEGDMQALTLSQSNSGLNLLAMLGCVSPGSPLRVISVHLRTEALSLSRDTIVIDGEEFPLAVRVSVDGEEFRVDESETTVNLEDDDPDPALHYNEITIYADTTSNDLLEAMADAEWIEISALGETRAAEFPPDMVKAMLTSCEATLRTPPFDATSRSAPDGDLAADHANVSAHAASRSMEGEWRGRYYEGEGHINFRMQLSRHGDTFEGSSYEPNTWVVNGPAEIRARIEGEIDGRRIRFTKTYEPAAGIYETIVYQGEFIPGDEEIQGQWHMTDRTGTFRMWQ